MTQLNQIVAIDKGVKENTNKATAPLFHAAKSGALFSGLAKTYEPLEENGEKLPDESVPVQATVIQLLEDFAKPVTRLIDVTLTKESANTEASADVVVDGHTLIKDAPVTFLLQFEKLLTQEVRGLIVSLPTLDPAQRWTPNESERLGIQETPVVQRARSKKVTRAMELAPATKEHPAQVQLVNEDILAGYWSERKFSGAIPGHRKQELVERVEKLIEAVKFAREKANSMTVTDKTAGAEVFGYLFSA